MINACIRHSLEKLRVGTQRQENKTDKLKVILKMLDGEYLHKLNT